MKFVLQAQLHSREAVIAVSIGFSARQGIKADAVR